jgi:alpha-glucosidase
VEPRHLVFDWTFINIPWSATAFRSAIAARDAAFGPERWPANVLSNHDQPRHGSRFGDGVSRQVGDARAKVAATLLLTLRGTPFLYYGEELGLRNLSIRNAEAKDPPARRASWLFPWWNRDQARGPMPWHPGRGGGFTTAQPWLPLPADADTRNVERQAADPASVLSWYRRLLRLRRETPALQAGGQQLLDAGVPSVLAYLRYPGPAADGEPGALIALNFGTVAAPIAIPPADSGSWRVAASTGARPEGQTVTGTIQLSPSEALVLVRS